MKISVGTAHELHMKKKQMNLHKFKLINQNCVFSIENFFLVDKFVIVD